MRERRTCVLNGVAAGRAVGGVRFGCLGRRLMAVLAALLALGCGSFAVAAAAGAGVGPSYTVVNLGVLSGDTTSSAEAVNVNGDVAGISSDTSAQNPHAFLYRNGNLPSGGSVQP